jgi:hypothetical protein
MLTLLDSTISIPIPRPLIQLLPRRAFGHISMAIVRFHRVHSGSYSKSRKLIPFSVTQGWFTPGLIDKALGDYRLGDPADPGVFVTTDDSYMMFYNVSTEASFTLKFVRMLY